MPAAALSKEQTPDIAKALNSDMVAKAEAAPLQKAASDDSASDPKGEPGEKKTVSLSVTPEALAFYDVHLDYVVEPGDFEIMVGNSSRDCDLQKVVLTVRK